MPKSAAARRWWPFSGGFPVSTRQSNSVLLWIVAFKAFKSVTLTALGVVLLNTRHTDRADLLTRLALAVHLPVSSELFSRAVTFASTLTVGKVTALAVTAFGYAILMGTEGVGLYYRKPWARWFTIIATSSLIPIEVYEIVREPGLLRIAVLLANVAIVVYLYRRKEVFE
jgi:uncharacterized membrane protein (DUF2068 family)